MCELSPVVSFLDKRKSAIFAETLVYGRDLPTNV